MLNAFEQGMSEQLLDGPTLICFFNKALFDEVGEVCGPFQRDRRHIFADDSIEQSIDARIKVLVMGGLTSQHLIREAAICPNVHLL